MNERQTRSHLKKMNRPAKAGPGWSNIQFVSPALMPRACALLLFLDVMQGQSLQHQMEEGLSSLTPQERAFAVELLLGSLRFYWSLAAQLSAHLKKPLNKQAKWLEAVLVLGAYQLHVMHTPARAVIHSMVELVRLLGYDHLTGLTNGVLRSLHRDIESRAILAESNLQTIAPLKIHEYLQTGHWLFRQIFEDWKPYFLAILEGFQRQPTLYLRVQQKKITLQEYQVLLENKGIQVKSLPEFHYELPSCLALAQTQNVTQLPGYADGLVSVQDYSAQVAVHAFALAIEAAFGSHHALTVLDACAAPGGKTAALLDVLPAKTKLHAVDIEPARLARTEENMARLGLLGPNLVLECADLALPNPVIDQVIALGGYDAILLDAPCSGTGVIGRHPDIQWCRQSSDISVLVDTQRRLLAKAEAALKPGGLLMYATCSILKKENSDNIEWYLQNTQTQLQIMPLDEQLGLSQTYGSQRLPLPDSIGDGFYYALFRKHG